MFFTIFFSVAAVCWLGISFGALFHSDASFVNRFGGYWRGRDRIVAEHAAIHSTVYSDMTLSNHVVAIDPLTDGVFVLHMRSQATMGDAMHHASDYQTDQ